MADAFDAILDVMRRSRPMRCEAASRSSPAPPAARARHRRSARRSRCDGDLHRPQQRRPATQAPTTTAPKPSRRQRNSSRTRWRRRRRSRSTTSTSRRCGRLADRLRDDYGAIDILVNDIWGAEVLKGPPPTWNRPIWEHDLDDGLRILRLGRRHPPDHRRTACCRCWSRGPADLLVEVTDGTKEYNDQHLPALGVLRPARSR